MSRPTKCRRVCDFPQTLSFQPSQGADGKTPVFMTVDEYETIRLIDKEGLSQEQCSVLMQVARTTVQRVYECARKKLAAVLVDGLPLRIEGGDFWLCDGRGAGCGHDDCLKRRYHQQYQKPKGDDIMRIAVTYENGQIFQRFGHTEKFKIYDIADGTILSSEIVDTDGNGHGALAGILGALHVDTLICGGIGGGAQVALSAAGIQLYGGVSGSADDAVNALISNRLEFDPNVLCDHHDHQHGDGHTCGNGNHCGGGH